MSDTTLVLRARWPSPEEALRARPAVESLMRRMAEAHDAWQEARRLSRADEQDEQLRSSFHDVFAALGVPPGLESYAGELDSPLLDPDADVRWRGSTLRITAVGWSGADWSRFAGALKTHFGAATVSWREARLA